MKNDEGIVSKGNAQDNVSLDSVDQNNKKVEKSKSGCKASIIRLQKRLPTGVGSSRGGE